VVHDTGESVGLSGDPGHQIAPVRRASGGHARFVDVSLANHGIDGRHRIAIGTISPASLNALGEVLSPARGAMKVRRHNHVTARGEELQVPTEVELIRSDAVRSAVQHFDERPLAR
jgi:hypothetical protein